MNIEEVEGIGPVYAGKLAAAGVDSTDDLLYNTGAAVTGSVNGSPKSSGYIAELDWLPRRDFRLALQYTGYREFNGARSNYDGFGRNARDNDTLYFLVWWML